MVATTRNSLISLVQIFNFFVRTWLCEDMAVEGHLGLTGYSKLQAPSGLSGRREARKSSWLLCSFAHAGREGISLSVLQTRKNILSLTFLTNIHSVQLFLAGHSKDPTALI